MWWLIEFVGVYEQPVWSRSKKHNVHFGHAKQGSRDIQAIVSDHDKVLCTAEIT